MEAVPPVRGQRGRPRRRPQRLYADRAYDARQQRQELRRRHIAPSLARRAAAVRNDGHESVRYMDFIGTRVCQPMENAIQEWMEDVQGYVP